MYRESSADDDGAVGYVEVELAVAEDVDFEELTGHWLAKVL
ncbi:hypothetical protein [Occallatibacter riparius]|nr:hypothetical protein [Occallatibacter riparius]